MKIIVEGGADPMALRCSSQQIYFVMYRFLSFSIQSHVFSTRYLDAGSSRRRRVFSFVFGNGDPNDGLEERRWKMVISIPFVTQVLYAIVTVYKDDESFILPVLLRFQGHPLVDDQHYQSQDTSEQGHLAIAATLREGQSAVKEKEKSQLLEQPDQA
uniref:Uncharacterized protein n=1 Tax=Aegilops tauschii TaxID=37682 RepID=R7VYG8_AEGTA